MCTISIDPTFIVALPVGNAVHISLRGTVTNCTGPVQVTVDCPGAPGSATTGTNAVINGNQWRVDDLVTECPCGTQPITITATCLSQPSCTATYITKLICICCPHVNTTVNNGMWNGSGQQLVTFVTDLQLPVGCWATVQRDFGDGSFGTPHTSTSTPDSYVETHAYNQGSYTSHLTTPSQPGCAPPFVQLTALSAPACAVPFSPMAALCSILHFFIVIFGPAAIVLFIASVSPLCLIFSPQLTAVAIGFAISAGIFMGLLYLFCNQCICGFFTKLLGELILITGAVSLMFGPAWVCMQPAPFPGPYAAFFFAGLLMAIGQAGLLLGAWYTQLKDKCPLNICDYWREVKYCMIASIGVGGLTHMAMLGGVTPAGVAVALAIIVVLLFNANLQIIINTLAQKC